MVTNFKTETANIETHPFGPVLPPDATVMMMGTFPPTADKWAMSFHYPNFYNDMWRIYGRVFFDDADYFRVGRKSVLILSVSAPSCSSAVLPLAPQ